MILWLNGAFGVGKTQTACELHYRLPGSVVFDPEEVGFFLARNLPPEASASDFQDLALWRKWVSELLKELQTDPNRVVLVPMTVVSPEYFSEIVEPLRNSGLTVCDYTLVASKATLEARLRRRGDGKAWNYHQIDRCLAGLASDVFDNRVDTDTLGLYEVVEHLLLHTGLSRLAVAGRNDRLSQAWRRWKVFFRHIRL